VFDETRDPVPETRTPARPVYAHPRAARAVVPAARRAGRAAPTAGANGHGPGETRASARSADVRVGARLRALRLERQVPLTTLSRRAGLSPGYLSQVENDLAMPSTTALGRLAHVLDIPLASFFEPSGERQPDHYVVRRAARRAVVYPGSTVHHELLVPDLRGKLEAVYCNAPRNTTSPTYRHEGEEFGYVIRGRLRVTVGDDVFVLKRGDAISYPSHLRHFWHTQVQTEMLWIATPPSW
jgi:transcriptional regulator with XRE-family HTH domain